MSGVSIVIPTLNESASLGRTLRCLSSIDPAAKEILVVDGGSRDGTVEIARSYNVKVFVSERAGRSIQMNRGAMEATGDILCFLHADTSVPDDLVTVINRTLDDPSVVCGGFISLMAGTETTRWGISLHNYLKTYLFWFKGLRLLFGDQVMFCRRADFLRCGGFDPSLPIMEEADLCLKLTQYGRIRQVNRVVRTSDRRVVKWGAWKATAIYVYIGFLWGIGVSATYLRRFYDDIR
jgi:rSAM/selenodomain-associated transferase 2